MSSANGTYTYLGPWINWSHGRVKGATLTLQSKYGGLLAAFLAIYVSFTGGMFWRLLSFILHQLYTTKPGRNRDGLHHQRQVILRNSQGASGALWEFAKLSVYWRGKTERPFFRNFLFAGLAALNVSIFGVASIFTSEITKVTGNSTLILGPACGGYKIDPNVTSTNGYRAKLLADTYQAATYVRQCYGDNPTNDLACNAYYRRSLGFTTNPNATCPFRQVSVSSTTSRHFLWTLA
jgi:hypothetical protein